MKLVWAICLVLGFGFASYGVLRESFAAFGDVARWDYSRYDEAVYASQLDAVLVRAGVALRLLPADGPLTPADRHRNAACAILGVLLLGVVTVLDICEKFLRGGVKRPRPSES